jgi:hypothetical protein
MNSFFKFALIGRPFIYILLVSALSNCGRIQKISDDLSSGGEVVSNPEVGVVTSNFYVRAWEEAGYTTHMHDASNNALPCEFQPNQTGVKKCIIEAQEHDLAFWGIKLQYNIPKSYCEYVEISPYYYYAAKPGVGPSSFNFDIDRDGLVGKDTDNDGTIDSDFLVDGTVGNKSYGGLIGDEPFCAYNYQLGNGAKRNCCVGSYVLTSRSWDPDAFNGAGGYSAASISNVSWGGSFSECLAGPAMATQDKYSSGYPVPNVYYVADSGINDIYEVERISPIPSSTIFAANYYNPADNGATPPLGLFPGTDVKTGATIPLPEEFYRLTCLDNAGEIRSELQIQVREWNLSSEFANWNKGGNPEAGVGFEPGFGSLFGQYNDYSDWRDMVNSGGATVFPFFWYFN